MSLILKQLYGILWLMHRAELNLYFGICPAELRRERSLTQPLPPEEFFKPGWQYLQIISNTGIVRNEREARSLVTYMEGAMPSSQELIVPHDEIEWGLGRREVRFWRVIQFGGEVAADKGHFLAVLRRSGFQPFNEEIAMLDLMAEGFASKGNGELLGHTKRLREVIALRAWEQALKYLSD